MLNYIFCFNRSITFPSDCFLPLVYLLKKRFLNFSTIPFMCPPFRPSIYLFVFSPTLTPFIPQSIYPFFLPSIRPSSNTLSIILSISPLSLYKHSSNTPFTNLSTCTFSRDGAERCGLFCAISLLLEKIMLDGQVNVQNILRKVRLRRKQAIPYKVSNDTVSPYYTVNSVTHFHQRKLVFMAEGIGYGNSYQCQKFSFALQQIEFLYHEDSQYTVVWKDCGV